MIKKISFSAICILTVLIGIMLLSPISVSAKEYERTTSYEKYLGSSGNRFNYDCMTDREKELYDDLYDTVIAFTKSGLYTETDYVPRKNNIIFEIYTDLSDWPEYLTQEEDFAASDEYWGGTFLEGYYCSEDASDEIDPCTIYDHNPFDEYGAISSHLAPAFMGDNTQFFWLNGLWRERRICPVDYQPNASDTVFTYRTGKGDDVIRFMSFMSDFYCSAKGRKAIEDRIVEVSTDWKELVEQVPETEHSDYFKGLYLAQIISQYVTYDEDEVFGRYNTTAHDLGGVFYYRKAVCQGFAEAYQFMGTLCGLDILQVGNGYHVWNQIKLDDNWYYVDCEFFTPVWRGGNVYGYDVHESGVEKITSYGTTESIYQNEYPYYMDSPYYGQALTVHYFNLDGFFYTAHSLDEVLEITMLPEKRTLADGTYGIKLEIDNMRDNYIQPLMQYEKTEYPDDPKWDNFKGHFLGMDSIAYSNTSDEFDYILLTTDPDIVYYVDDTPVPPVAPATGENIPQPCNIIWANGNKDNKSVALKTSLTATNWTDSKGKSKSGKLMWLAMSSKTEPALDTSHKVTTKTDCKSIATVSSKGVVTAKTTGTVYIYAIDTGSGNYEEFEVVIKGAPTKLKYTTDGNPESDVVKKVAVDIGETCILNITPEIKKGTYSSDANYTAIPGKTEQNTNIEITLDRQGGNVSVAVKGLKANATKTVSTKVITTNTESGKKASVTVVVTDSTKELTGVMTGTVAKKNDVATIALDIVSADGDAITTDKYKVYVSATAPVVNDTGKKVTVTASKEVKATISKDYKSISLKASKDVSEALGVYAAITNPVTKMIRIIKVADIV